MKPIPHPITTEAAPSSQGEVSLVTSAKPSDPTAASAAPKGTIDLAPVRSLMLPEIGIVINMPSPNGASNNPAPSTP